MKEKETEATWLTTFGWFFDTIENHIHDSGGTIVKYLGDGAMAFYHIDSVAKAINAAIKIQEDIDVANHDNTVSISCTIGISQGKMRTFKTQKNGGTDYIGNVVDKAARLSGVASPKAIFADDNTINAAVMPQVSSKRGSLSQWEAKDYIGSQQQIMLKGFSRSVKYYEIRWGDQAYGVKSQYATDIAKETDIQTPPIPQGREREHEKTHTKNKKIGTVYSLREDIGCSFIRDGLTNQEYYTDNRFVIVGSIPLANDAQVFFLEKDSLKAGAKPLAAAVVTIGGTYSGKITHINSKNVQKQLASIELLDTTGNIMDIFAYLGDNSLNISKGESVKFEIAYHQKGPSALNIRR